MKKAIFSYALTAAGVLALGIAPTVANAATNTTTFTVSANVQSTCAISVPALPFGNYTGSQLNVSTPVTVTCTNTTPYNVGLDAGATTGATTTTRQMLNGTTKLNYILFQDSGQTKNWGNTNGTDTVAGTGSGAAQTLTIYGRIPAGQYVTPLAFTDTVTATITY